MKINYVSNFKIKKIYFKKIYINTGFLQNKRFLLWLLILKIMYPKSLIFFKFLFKPIKLKKFNILRAPYKNKLAQNSYAQQQYKFSIYFYSLKSLNKLKYFNFLKNLFKKSFLGTNISFEQSVVFFFKYKLQF